MTRNGRTTGRRWRTTPPSRSTRSGSSTHSTKSRWSSLCLDSKTFSWVHYIFMSSFCLQNVLVWLAQRKVCSYYTTDNETLSPNKVCEFKGLEILIFILELGILNRIDLKFQQRCFLNLNSSCAVDIECMWWKTLNLNRFETKVACPPVPAITVAYFICIHAYVLWSIIPYIQWK
jgi:hypothetical protein